MSSWEISITNSLTARRSIHKTVVAIDLPTLIADTLKYAASLPPVAGRGWAVLVTRSDTTPEARREQWEADFYDRDKAGRRRRRYKKSQTEREWEEFFAKRKKEALAAQKAKRAYIAKEKPEWRSTK